MADLPGLISWNVAVIMLFIVVSQIDCLIEKHEAQPSVVANCSSVRLVCVVNATVPDVEVWWTFSSSDGDENVSKLPNVTILPNNAVTGEWQLLISCATSIHNKSYVCNARTKNASEIVYRKETYLLITVPPVIKAGQDITYEVIGEQVNLTCSVHAVPIALVDWLKNGETVNITDEHFQVNTANVDNATVLSTLYIDVLERQDNGTYACNASNGFNSSMVTQDLIVQEPPVVEFLPENIVVHDPSTVMLQWHLLFDGNLPVQRFLLLKEDSLEPGNSTVDANISPNISSYTLYSLLPGLMYTFYISAENNAGLSSWDYVNVSLPAVVPPKVSWVHVLASTNETLLFGWRRPIHDNGADITHYTIQLRHEGILITNQTMDVQAPGRNNLMFLFGHLEAGETYSFRVQACSSLGCGNWSEALDGTTSDGFADPPRNIEVKCERNSSKDSEFINVTWDIPENARGTVLSYNLTILSTAEFRDDNGMNVEEKTTKIEIIDVKSNQLEYTMEIQPNTEYTVQMCTVNRGGCGSMSNITANSQCRSASNVPSSLPHFYMQRMNSSDECRQLKLNLQRVNERNGSVLCYRVVMIRLRKGQDVSKLPSDPEKLVVSTYENVHKNAGYGAYVAEAFNSAEFVPEVVIGDNQQHYCDTIPLDKKRHISGASHLKHIEVVHDGRLSPDTNYTGFIEIKVGEIGPNATVLTKASPYFTPVLTVKFSLLL